MLRSRSRQWPPQQQAEVSLDSVKLWKQVLLNPTLKSLDILFYLQQKNNQADRRSLKTQIRLLKNINPCLFYPEGPCCPAYVNVTQVTQAMTNVTWSTSSGARSFVTTLMSPRGEAKCHTLDTNCLMGCITCSTNYSVNLEAISATGHKSQCTYSGFSSSEDKDTHTHRL